VQVGKLYTRVESVESLQFSLLPLIPPESSGCITSSTTQPLNTYIVD